MRTRWILGTICLGAVLAATQTPTAAPGNDSIRPADLEADVRFLAGDDMQGRQTGTPGNRRAAAFISSRFARLGLAGLGPDGAHEQPFDLTTTRLGAPNTLEVTGIAATELSLGTTFYPDPASASGEAAGDVVFVGFGIADPRYRHDDYQSADLAGKVALMLNHEPGEFDPDGRFDGEKPSEAARAVRKIRAAQDAGAIAVLVAPDVHNHAGQRGPARPMQGVWPSRPRREPRYQLANWVQAIRIPVVQISGDLAAEIVERSGYSLQALAALAEEPGGISAISLPGPRIQLTATVIRETLPNHNVVGFIEGADPRRRDEWILVSAHLDHMGMDDSRVFNGADDNASGVAGLIEIAEAYRTAATGGFRPPRSILLAAWNSEEQGLLGAWAYTEAPLHPLAQTVAVLNMDMIGRDEEVPEDGGARFRGLSPQAAETNRNSVNLLGYSHSPDLRRVVEHANVFTGLRLRFRYDDNPSNLLRRSDQWPFLYLGVPAMFVHTGLHPDYHTERDRPDLLNYEKMARIVRLVHQVSWDLAQAETRPAYVPR